PTWDSATARLIATVVLPSLGRAETTSRSRGALSWLESKMEACRLRIASASGENGWSKNDTGKPFFSEPRFNLTLVVGTSVSDGSAVHFSTSSAVRIVLSNPSRMTAIRTPPKSPSTTPRARFNWRRDVGLSSTRARSTTRTLLDFDAAVIPASLMRAYKEL